VKRKKRVDENDEISIVIAEVCQISSVLRTKEIRLIYNEGAERHARNCITGRT